jgi:hypothetical protein
VERGLARIVEGSRVSRGTRRVRRCIMVRSLLGCCVVVIFYEEGFELLRSVCKVEVSDVFLVVINSSFL